MAANAQELLNQQLLREAKNRNPEQVLEHLQAGADVNTQVGMLDSPPIYHAANNGDDATIKILLEHGANVDLPNSAGSTALHRAALNGSLLCVKILLAAGANLHTENLDKQTPLESANIGRQSIVSHYLEEVMNGIIPLPTPKDVGLDMGKRNAALETLEKNHPQSESSKYREAITTQRTAALENKEQGL